MKEGIVLKGVDYKESSKILYTLTANGVESIFAEGAKKIKSSKTALIQPLTLISFETTTNNRTLIDGEILNDFNNIKTDIKKMTLSLEIMEMVYYFNETIANKELLYTFTKTILERTNDANDEYFYFLVFALKLLYLLGVAPTLIKCLKCSTKDNLSFSVKSGGTVCVDHLDHFSKRYEVKDIDILRKLYLTNINDLKEFEIPIHQKKVIRGIIDEYYQDYLGYVTRSRKMVFSVFGY